MYGKHGLEMATKIGELGVKYGVRGSVSYSVEVYRGGNLCRQGPL